MRSPTRLLLIVLAVAFVLRISGVLWGIPLFDELTDFYHPDEPKIVNAAEQFPEHIESNRDLRYPTLCGYLVGTLALPLKYVEFEDQQNRYLTYFVVARLVTVLLGTACVWLVYRLMSSWLDRGRGLLAAAFTCVAFYHAQNSAWATTDVPSSFVLTLFLLVATRAWQPRGGIGRRIVSGLVLGALVSTKYTGALAAIAVPLLLLTAKREPDEPPPWSRERRLRLLGHLTLFGLSAAAVLLLTTPGIVVQYDAFLESLEFERSRIAQLALPYTNPWTWEVMVLYTRRAIGWPLAAVGLLGLLLPFRRHKIAPLAITLALYLTSGAALFPRYVILIVPCYAIGAADLLGTIARSKWKLIRWFGYAAIAATLGYSAYFTVSGLIARYPDTRTAAAHFIADNVADGTTVGLVHIASKRGWRTHRWQYPKVDFDRVVETEFFDHPDVLVVSSRDARLIHRVLESGKIGEDFSWPEELNHWFYRREPPTPEMLRFYTEFVNGSEYELWQDFAKGPRMFEFKPPDIAIYRRN